MYVEIRQSDLRNDNALVMRRVAEGESFVVTVNGHPVADVVPHRSGTRRRRFVPVAELAEVFAADPSPNLSHDFGTSAPPDPGTRRADLASAQEFPGSDEPADPFGPEPP